MADKKTSTYTKLVYGSESDRALIENARKAILRADQFMYEQGLKDKEYNKRVEEFNKLIDENPQWGVQKMNKLPVHSLGDSFQTHLQVSLAMTVRYILLLALYGVAFVFLIWLLQKI